MTASVPARATLVVDDHPVVRRGLVALLSGEEWAGEIREAATVGDALSSIHSAPPAIAIVDLRLPDGDGTQVIKALTAYAPGCRSVVLTMESDARLVRAALDGGAAGYLLKPFNVTELITLTCDDIALGGGAHVRCMGKGRKERATPIRKDSIKLLRDWLAERNGKPDEPLFISNRGTPLSRDAVEGIVHRHIETASRTLPSLRGKRVTPHVLRHSAAMQLLHGGVDRTVIALWLGHESVETTQMYIHADMKMKEKAIAKTRPIEAKHGRYRPSDKLLSFLEAL